MKNDYGLIVDDESADFGLRKTVTRLDSAQEIY
jgi:hypothetical protein